MRRLFAALALLLLGIVALWLVFGQGPDPHTRAYAPPGRADQDLASQPAPEPQALDATPRSEANPALPTGPIPYDQLKSKDDAAAPPEKHKSDDNTVFY